MAGKKRARVRLMSCLHLCDLPPSPMHAFTRRRYRWLRHLPRKRHLKGGWLHRRLGERLFAPELWRPARREVAAGLAVGLFIGFTPTMGVQILLAAAAAYLLRVNIPAALVGALVTNPFTAPVIYQLEYQLGVWLVGVPEPRELEGYGGALRNFARHAKPLWAGSLVAGGVNAALSYMLVLLLWREAAHLRATLHHKPNEAADETTLPAPPDETHSRQGEPATRGDRDREAKEDADAG